MRTYRIFLSSPGDVLPERNRAQAVIERLNAEHPGGVPFTLTRWEDAYYSAADTFQQQIASPGEHDIVVFIFWKRLGTDLPPRYNRTDGTSRTGTEYEFEEALGAREARSDLLPDILVYRKTAKVLYSEESVDLERAQKKALDQFWERWFRTSAGHFVAGFQSFSDGDDFERQFERNLREWMRRHAERDVAWDVERQGSPYRGLAAFGEDYAGLFFGRDGDIARARARLIEAGVGGDRGRRGTAFLLILGASGSGKSSLLRAGLLPRLRSGGVPGLAEDGHDRIDGFRCLTIVPRELGADLCAGFAAALYAADGGSPALPELAEGDFASPSSFAALAARSPESAAECVVRALDRLGRTPGSAHRASATPRRWGLLLALDQLEELFSGAEAERQSFARLLAALADCGRVWIVATMRNDFYDRLRLDPTLSRLCDQGRSYDLAPPTLADYRAIIRQPAAAAGLVFESTASRDLASDIESEAGSDGALPMIAFLLDQLFRERRGNVLTLDTYDRLGGAAGALAKHGDEVIAALAPNVRDAFPRVVRRLVRKGLADSAAVSAAAPLASFAPGSPDLALVEALRDARLVSTFSIAGGAPSAATTSVRWAHEALLLRWPRLRALIDADRRDFETLDRTKAAASLWEATAPDSKDARLLTGLALAEATDLVARWGPDVDEPVRAFVRAGVQYAERHRRRRRYAISTVVAGLALLAVLASVAAIVALRERGDAVKARERAERETRTAQETSDFLVGIFKVVDPGEARGNSITAREILDRGATRVRTELRSQPYVQSKLMATIGSVYDGLGLYAVAAGLLDDALRIASAVPGADPAELARIRVALAADLVNREKYAEAEPVYRAAIAVFDSRPSLAREAAATRTKLGFLYWAKGDYPSARPMLEDALQRDQAVFGPRSTEAAGTMQSLAISLRDMGERDRALELLQRSNEIFRERSGEDSMPYAMGLEALGFTLVSTSRHEEARTAILAAVRIMEHQVGPDHPMLAVELSTLGMADNALGKYDEAIEVLNRALRIHVATLGPGSKEASRTMRLLGTTYGAIGDHARSLGLYKQAAEIILRRTGERSEEYASVVVDIGREQRIAGLTDEAVATLRHGVTLFEQLSSDPMRLASSLANLADALCVRNVNEEGYRSAQRALSLAPQALPPLARTIVESEAAYCDPDPARMRQNLATLTQASESVTQRYGRTAPQLKDIERRLARFRRVWHQGPDA